MVDFTYRLGWSNCKRIGWCKALGTWKDYPQLLCTILTPPPTGMHIERWEALIMEHVERDHPGRDIVFRCAWERT